MRRVQNVTPCDRPDGSAGDELNEAVWYRLRRLAHLVVFCLVLLCGLPVLAADPLAQLPLPQPQDEVLLTITGQIGRHNGTGPDGRKLARFDRAMLEKLGWSEVVTATPWHSKVMRFEGVPLSAVLDAVAAGGETLQASALNDYTAQIPVADARRYNVILAMKADGVPLVLRDKGPLFIIYPYDSDRALQTDSVYIRSVWQLNRIDVRP